MPSRPPCPSSTELTVLGGSLPRLPERSKGPRPSGTLVPASMLYQSACLWVSEWETCSLPSPWKSRPGAECWGPQHRTRLLTGRLCIVRFGACCVAPWGPGIACVGVLDTFIPRPHWRPLLIPNHGGASLESFASIPRQNARVQDHFHRALVSFPAATSFLPPPPQHPPYFRRPRLIFPGSLQ